MAYILHMIVPKANGLGVSAHAYAAHEGMMDGKPHFWYSVARTRAIEFETEEEAVAFNNRYLSVGELDRPMDVIKVV